MNIYIIILLVVVFAIGIISFLNLICSAPKTYKVEVHEYNNHGGRATIWSKTYCTYDSARTAGQAVMFYVEHKTPHAIGYEVMEIK